MRNVSQKPMHELCRAESDWKPPLPHSPPADTSVSIPVLLFFPPVGILTSRLLRLNPKLHISDTLCFLFPLNSQTSISLCVLDHSHLLPNWPPLSPNPLHLWPCCWVQCTFFWTFPWLTPLQCFTSWTVLSKSISHPKLNAIHSPGFSHGCIHPYLTSHVNTQITSKSLPPAVVSCLHSGPRNPTTYQVFRLVG